MTAEVKTKVIEIPYQLTVRQLAEHLGISPISVIKELMNNGIMASINQTIDFDTAAIVGEELGFELVPFREEEPEPAAEVEKAVSIRQQFIASEDPANLKPRPPVVTILGHVDHGKTTLLDTIRNTNVVEGEAGGITQHIGAYQVEVDGRKITFVDTPGHAAFTAMRARGAMVTDLAVLIVAADDGVMPQTREAIGHARAAGVPILVAINKIDKANANLEKVKQDLANEGLVPEDWGGETVCVPISALNNIGIDELLDNILLAADVAELKANPNRLAQGTVLEGKLDERRGPVANLLVQNGTLKQGDVVVIGTTYGRVRAMFDHRGRKVKTAPPSTPVSILGMPEVPRAGDIFEAVKNRKAAEALVAERQAEQAETHRRSSRAAPVTLEDFLSRLEGEEVKELNLIVKADVYGSLEPVVNSLKNLGDDQHKVRIIYQGTGNISESDVMLAVASEAIVIGFNVQVDEAARRTAEAEHVEIKLYRIIYKLIEDIELALKGLYEPVYEERVIGHAEVRAVFKAGKKNVAGCYVTAGKITRNALVRVVRNRELIHTSSIASLRRFTEDVEEVATGFECGIGVEGFDRFAVGDILEAYIREQVN
ncbi:MAG: translation initiation factor IF-2 [Caldilineae bacterium]|nr:MAG: translation initiation factor IF-2 [Caldilineae bacterium]